MTPHYHLSYQTIQYLIICECCQIIYFITKPKSHQMTSHYSRGTYSPYSKGNMQENEQLPLRNKAFSQIDNTVQNYSQSQYSNATVNQDKINQIKKKYDKLLGKSNNKSNQENMATVTTPNDFGKSVSTFDAYDENSKWGPYNKSYQTPTTNKERRNADPYEGVQNRNIPARSYAQRQYFNPTKNDTKSHLQSNRMTLNAMKSELQSKLDDLSAKTTGSSALRNPSTQPKQSQKRQQVDNNSYEAILSKYSKNIAQHRGKSVNQVYSKQRDRHVDVSINQKMETLQTKIKDTTTSSYIPKYTNANRNNTTTIERQVKDRQLSTISQISNSNHSENPSYQIEIKDHKQKIYEKYRQIQNSVKENAQSNIIICKPAANENQPETNNWYRNTTSYMDNKLQQPKRQPQANMEFTLQRLQNSEGFSITRTVTQENFTNLNKLNQIQARFEQRERVFSGANTYGKPPSQPIKKATSAATGFNKYEEQNSIKQSQKFAQDKSEIQKLKEKYSVSTTSKYINPYREKRSDLQSSYTKEARDIKNANPSKETKQQQAKVEPRNNEVISKEIEKLDMKIKQIQQNKKELNINFRPYDVSKVPTSTQLAQTSLSNNNNLSKTNENYSNISLPLTANNDSSKYNARYQAYLAKVKPLYSQITLSQSQKAPSSGFAIKLMPVEYDCNEEALTDRSASQTSSISRINQYKNKVELENRTDFGIEERKKKLQDKVETNNNIKHLVKAFGQQAVLDEIFRNNKIWFASERDNKWNELKKQLNVVNITLSQTQLKSIFNLDESQNNPFFSVSDNKCNMKTLVQSFKQAQKHWQQKIEHKFSRADLQNQGFSSSKIDYDKKGCLEVEDLVRFLNIQSGTFLRNRDVSIIFKRLSNNSNKLQFSQLLNLISK